MPFRPLRLGLIPPATFLYNERRIDEAFFIQRLVFTKFVGTEIPKVCQNEDGRFVAAPSLKASMHSFGRFG